MSGASRHRLPKSADPLIPRLDLAMYVEGTVYGVIHNAELTDNEKRAALAALSDLVRGLSVYFAERDRCYGSGSEGIFFRSAGFDPSGDLSRELLSRIAEESGGESLA